MKMEQKSFAMIPLLDIHTDEMVEIAAGTGFFKEHEVQALREVLDDFHKENHEYEHKGYLLQDDRQKLGFVYYAPAPMTEGTWQLWWIVVQKELQGKGLGGHMLKEVENHVLELGGRVLFIETSSQEKYESTRKFYLKYGYNLEARLRGFYAAGDDMMVYRKSLKPE
ncbi:MAG: GNAT family N-acetyltransferase [Gemmataceae bacterium]|jgi:ribosomal protein S18 acetylase RimI-like enzyme